MKRAVEIGARVGDHLDLADVELGASGIVCPGGLPREKIADHGRGETFVRDHPMLDLVAEIDQPARSSLCGHRVSRGPPEQATP